MPAQTGWGTRWAVVGLLAVLAACSAEPDAPEAGHAPPAAVPAGREPIITISRDQQVSPVPEWRAPDIEVDEENVAALREDADAALASGELYGEADDAIPLYLALRERAPEDSDVQAALGRAVQALVARGDEALASIDEEPRRLREAQQVAAVAREVAPMDEAVVAFLSRLDVVEQAQQENLRGEQALNQRLHEPSGEAKAIGHFRRALELRPGDVRALQGVAAVESALIRQAELAADQDQYAVAEEWLERAEQVRPDMDTADQARLRIARQRGARVRQLRDLGIAALGREGGLDQAREQLATLLAIAPPGDAAGTELRDRIELATHYGLFRPGQRFTDGLDRGGRGPELVVIPHGAFEMGAPAGEHGSTDAERPVRTVRFDRGLAVSRTEVTVGEFRRFIAASNHRTRASRRGYSIVYDERSGNLVRRSGVDWSRDYAGDPADDDMPVVHVSAPDAIAYVEWLSEQTGQSYRLPSEAEFEYMLRAGSQARYPWGEGDPAEGAGNFTGGEDESPSGRRWRNAFEGYGDGAWGPGAVGSWAANPFGLHDMAGNVSEWVADCWHDGYRRAPADGRAWINPGCRENVVRGGSWASSPVQTRSAWRTAASRDTTNARIGFRVVRDI